MRLDVKKIFFFLACFSFLGQNSMTKTNLGRKRFPVLHIFVPFIIEGSHDKNSLSRQELGRMLLTGWHPLLFSSAFLCNLGLRFPCGTATVGWFLMQMASLKTMSQRHAQRPIEHRRILQLRSLFPGLSSCVNFTKIAPHSTLEETHLKYNLVIL